MNVLEWAIMVLFVVVFHRTAYELVRSIAAKRTGGKKVLPPKSNTKDW